ncbi:hypothetical protein [Sphaerotilus sp.]|uniref:hypothetical protein n=1 Tax=Sphaerotilus sp. TaxID=2093942 RepID=UPI00286E12EF|nr:hypothetical protein [Sphaerotilus sp.]
MNSPLSSPHRYAGSGHEASPARACGRRLLHTRRYVTSLIHLAKTMDIHAIKRLRQRARQSGRGAVLGLTALTETLILPTPELGLPHQPTAR